MTTEEENNTSPFITINGIQLTADELPDTECRRWFAQLQILNQQKAKQAFDLERTQIAIDGFSAKLVDRYNEEEEVKESSTESDEDSE